MRSVYAGMEARAVYAQRASAVSRNLCRSRDPRCLIGDQRWEDFRWRLPSFFLFRRSVEWPFGRNVTRTRRCPQRSWQASRDSSNVEQVLAPMAGSARSGGSHFSCQLRRFWRETDESESGDPASHNPIPPAGVDFLAPPACGSWLPRHGCSFFRRSNVSAHLFKSPSCVAEQKAFRRVYMLPPTCWQALFHASLSCCQILESGRRANARRFS